MENLYTTIIISAEQSHWNGYGDEYPTRVPVYGKFIHNNNNTAWYFELTPLSDEELQALYNAPLFQEEYAHFQPDFEPNDEPQEPKDEPQPNNANNDDPLPDNANHAEPPLNNADAPHPLSPPAPQTFDQYGIPTARARATNLEKFHDIFAVVDHISGSQCLGFAGATFNKLNYYPAT